MTLAWLRLAVNNLHGEATRTCISLACTHHDNGT